MKKDQDNIDLIEQYLEGKLDKESMSKVEEHLETDKGFAEQFKTYKFLMDGIKYSGRKELHKSIREWDKELSEIPEETTPLISIKNKRWYYMAASILFFLVVSLVLYSNLNFGYDRLVADYYTRYDHYTNTKRSEKSEISEIEKIIGYYEYGEYQDVINKIIGLDESQKSDATDFILANVYQETGKYDDAIIIYSKVIISGNSPYENASKWYMALCYLSLNQPEQAIPVLQELENLKSSYSIKAKKLLQDLDS